jgi:hypothetical protein
MNGHDFRIKRSTIGLSIVVFAAACLAQQPRVQNAQMDTRTASSPLEPQFRQLVQSQASPAWIAYTLPRTPRQNGGDWDYSWGCSLEGNYNGVVLRDKDTPLQLEGPTSMYVLFRVDDHKVQRLRTLGPDCLLDAGGLPFISINNVKPADSVALMESLLKDTEPIGNLIYTIAYTRDPAADAALERLSAPTQTEKVRRSVANYLADIRGRNGYNALARMLRDDPSDSVRMQVVSALAHNKEPDAIPAVIQAAKADKSEKVRKRAIQALTQSKDPRATRFFEDVLAK